MDKEKVINILLFFRNIDNEIKLNQKIISDIENTWYSNVGAINMDGMPHSKGSVSSPTETAALNIPDSVSKQIRSLQKENETLGSVRKEILTELAVLTYAQKVTIWDFYIKGLQWVQISGRLHYSDRHCKNIRTTALKILAVRFARNKTIKNYSFPN